MVPLRQVFIKLNRILSLNPSATLRPVSNVLSRILVITLSSADVLV